MDFVHCNLCGHLPRFADKQNQRRYFIASCGHVFCNQCVRGLADDCRVCQKPGKTMEINNQAGSDIKAFFSDPAEVLRNNLKQTSQVMGFQKAQLKSYQSIVARLFDSARKASLEVRDLKNEIEALKRKNEALEQEQQNLIGTGARVFNPLVTPEHFFAGSPRDLLPSSTTGGPMMNTPGSSCNGFQTPFNMQMSPNSTNFNLWPTPAMSRNSSTPGRASGTGGVNAFASGRLTLTKNSFSAAPGAGRPVQEQGEILTTTDRLRQLRCFTSAPPTEANRTNNTPSPRLRY